MTSQCIFIESIRIIITLLNNMNEQSIGLNNTNAKLNLKTEYDGHRNVPYILQDKQIFTGNDTWNFKGSENV